MRKRPRRALGLPAPDELVIVRMGADPEPNKVIPMLYSEGSMM